MPASANASQYPTPEVSPEPGENQRIIEMLKVVLRTVESIVPGTAEVVVHEIARLPESIVAIAGNVTGRRIGDPATDVLLQAIAQGAPKDNLGEYATVLADGRVLTSSTTIIRNSVGEPVAALCVNADRDSWTRLRELVNAMSGEDVAFTTQPPPEGSGERFAHDVDELASHLIADTLAGIGVPVDLMKKEHKMAAVGKLRERGMFMLKDSMETVAAALNVTRFTIYNYLHELDEENGSHDPS
jgi:predicted transcriptional regulator YheO